MDAVSSLVTVVFEEGAMCFGGGVQNDPALIAGLRSHARAAFEAALRRACSAGTDDRPAAGAPRLDAVESVLGCLRYFDADTAENQRLVRDVFIPLVTPLLETGSVISSSKFAPPAPPGGARGAKTGRGKRVSRVLFHTRGLEAWAREAIVQAWFEPE